ncbi:MAG: MgtC/SapB family protein, partial [Thermoanaerobaculia bacterium]
MTQDALEVAGQLALAAVLAGLIGAERERSGKWAGLRTHMLMAVGAALITHISIQIGARYAEGSNSWDPGRIASQILPGVGFIGAGTIIQARGRVHGLTTAAGLWVVSAIGMAVGGGFYLEAVFTTVVILLVLAALRPLERLLRGDRRSVELVLKGEQRISRIFEILEQERIVTDGVSVSRTPEGVSLQVKLRGSAADAQRLVRLAGRGENAA